MRFLLDRKVILGLWWRIRYTLHGHEHEHGMRAKRHKGFFFFRPVKSWHDFFCRFGLLVGSRWDLGYSFGSSSMDDDVPVFKYYCTESWIGSDRLDDWQSNNITAFQLQFQLPVKPESDSYLYLVP